MGCHAVFSDLYEKMREQLDLGEDDATDPKSRCIYCTWKIRIADFDDLQPGDHISFGGKHCKFTFNDSQVTLYKHHSIVRNVERINETSGITTLIHFYSLSFDGKIQIRETKELLDLATYEVYKVKYSYVTDSPEKIIERAEKFINSGQSYSPITCNCEHFCHLCCIGNSTSSQVNDMYDILRQIGTGALTIGGKVGKTVATMILANSVQAASCICVPWGYLSLFAIGYLIFCVYRHQCLNKETACGEMCSSCCSRRKMDLWSRFFFNCISLAGGIGLLSVILAAGASTGVVAGCLVAVSALSIALMVAIPKLKKKLAPPFTGQTVHVEKPENISIGDSISFKYKLMMHDGIVSYVEKISETMASVSVIHYSLPRAIGRRIIKEKTLSIDFTKDAIKKHDYSSYNCHPPEIVVQRAKQRIGETRFGMFSNRSCHFCHWAKVKEDVEDEPKECQEPVPELRFERSLKIGEDIKGMVQINVDHSINKQHATKTIGKQSAYIPQEVKEGSLIQFKKGKLNQWHSAVTTDVKYSEESPSKLTVKVIHYDVSKRLREDKLEFDLHHVDVRIYKYHPIYRHSRKDVIRRARERKDHGQYNVIRYKSAHLTKDIFGKDRDELVTNFDMVKPGDVIIFYYWSLKHAAIVVKIGESSSKANNRARVTIIHYALDTLFSTRTIRQETVLMDLSCDHVYRRDYEDVTYSRQRVISRAKSRLGEQRFNINGNTSWHLVHWAKVVQTPCLVNKYFDSESCITCDTRENLVLLPNVATVVEQHFQRVPVYAWRDLQPGIIIEYRYYWIWHQAILTDLDFKASQITVIHYGTNTLFSTRTIMKDTFRIDLKQTKLWMYICDPNLCNPLEVIVVKAYERLGEQKWGRENTTWDFCKDCVLKKVK